MVISDIVYEQLRLLRPNVDTSNCVAAARLKEEWGIDTVAQRKELADALFAATGRVFTVPAGGRVGHIK